MRSVAAVLGSIVLIALASVIGAPRAEAKEVTFVIEMRARAYSPDFLQVDPGERVTIIVFNNESGMVPHTFDLDALNVHLGTTSDPILPGENGTATFTAERAGTYYFHCAIPTHATSAGGGTWAGMAGRIQVGPAPPPGDPTPIIVGGVLILIASVAILLLIARRGKQQQKSP